ncbi:MAG: IS5 family transposase [Candidatus Micrarchaeota archaeon]|nr:IS5 family transposase [Candidatus Micrarchaeota archaeon]MDE1833916.1 IS5 family transposase [Candidatus Micrarchaeota archaeon]
MYVDDRDWNRYNRQLCERGRILTLFLRKEDLEFKEELRRMNKKKEGRKYKYPNTIIQAGFSIKCLFHLGYRQLQNLMEDICLFLRFPIPNFRTFWWRIDVMERQELKFDLPKGKKIEIAVDSTGLKLANDGEYRTTKYGKRKVWAKMHANINIETNEAVNIIITKDNIGDSKKFKPLIDPLKSHVLSVRADKGYDTVNNFRYCQENNIQAIIPVKINASPKRKGARQTAVREQFCIPPTHERLNLFDTLTRRIYKQKVWKKIVKYGFRWFVEGFYSRFKRIFGEYVFSRKWKNIKKEIVAKVNILNLFATMR